MISEQQLTDLAQQVFERLKRQNKKVVLAESCTGGLASAVLTRIPGISEFHCGSAVVYQVARKAAWIGIPEALLINPGPVSREVAAEMAVGVLRITPQADISAAVTGHLGPGAPPDQDGLVYLAFARRTKTGAAKVNVLRLELAKEPGDQLKAPLRRRLRRQRSAVVHVLKGIIDILS